MKISSLQATPVSVPTLRPCAWSQGTGYGSTRTILEVTTGDGLVGLGECEGPEAATVLNGWLGKKLHGLSIHDIGQARALCRMGFRDYGSLANNTLIQCYAAVEMALWDLIGKKAGAPVFALLGGAVRERAEFGAYAYSFELDTAGMSEQDVPDAMARVAAEAIVRTGAGTFEFKVGRFSEETDIETIRAVRAALGDRIVLGVDANMAYDLDRTRRVLRAVEAARLDWFEEPVASLVEMQRLSQEFPVRLSSHCTDLEKLPLYPGIEGSVGDLHFQGGLLGVAREAAALRSQGRRFWQRSSLELGVSWAAMVHLGISCPDLGRDSQSLIDWVEDDLVQGAPWLLKDGGRIPPERPGLGVELDRAALDRYAEAFRARVEFTYFDGP